MNSKICLKKVSMTLVAMLMILISHVTQGQTGNQSCEAGGEMWVCGGSQIVQASSDFDANCGHMTYESCTVLRTIIDVCSPDMREAQIFEPGGPDCPLNRL